MVSFPPHQCAAPRPRLPSRRGQRGSSLTPHMSISQDQVVSIHYTLRDEAGKIIDSSPAGEPLAYLHGHGNLVPGLERELAGRSVGDKLTVTLSPADGYGEHDSKLVRSEERRVGKGWRCWWVPQRSRENGNRMMWR